MAVGVRTGRTHNQLCKNVFRLYGWTHFSDFGVLCAFEDCKNRIMVCRVSARGKDYHSFCRHLTQIRNFIEQMFCSFYSLSSFMEVVIVIMKYHKNDLNIRTGSTIFPHFDNYTIFRNPKLHYSSL